MGRRRPRYSSGRAGSSQRTNRKSGIERAQQHIREAAELSRELGGTDKDVKAYFFSLPAHELAEVFRTYGEKYGLDTQEYAEQTIDKWRSGRTQMSGLVASRLFALLPPRMPISNKFKLTESLWAHVGPSSHKALRIGPHAALDDILRAASAHADEVVSHYNIPEGMERRFDWLSAGDVGVKQQLLNHVRQMEKALILSAAKTQVPIMLAHMRSDSGALTHHMMQTLTVGKHTLDIVIVKGAEGVTLVDPSAARPNSGQSSGSGDWGWIWWLLGAAIIWLLVAKR